LIVIPALMNRDWAILIRPLTRMIKPSLTVGLLPRIISPRCGFDLFFGLVSRAVPWAIK